MSKKLGFEPTANRIFVLADPKQDATASGIILTHVKNKHNKGTVVSVGLRRDGSEMSIEEGDRATFDEDRGVDVEINNVTYKIFEESEILWYTKSKK